MLYQEPRMEILKIETEDVICASDKDYYEGKNDGNYSDVNSDENWT